MQESVGALSFPSLSAAGQLDLPSPHREPWSLRAAAATAALLLHALVVLFLLWSFLTSMLWPQKPPTEMAIPITIVQEPPKAPPPPPPSPKVEQPFRHSGPDRETDAAARTSPRQQEEVVERPQPSQQETTPEAPEKHDEEAGPVPSSAGEATTSSGQLPLPAVKPLQAAKHKAQQGVRATQRNTAVRVRTGDQYLNAASDWIERFRTYPPLARAMQLRGWARYVMVVDRSGRVLDVKLKVSTGYDMLDREGERILRAASPLPALPPDIPGNDLPITVDIDIHP